MPSINCRGDADKQRHPVLFFRPAALPEGRPSKTIVYEPSISITCDRCETDIADQRTRMFNYVKALVICKP
jgi:hypothetical protein